MAASLYQRAQPSQKADGMIESLNPSLLALERTTSLQSVVMLHHDCLRPWMMGMQGRYGDGGREEKCTYEGQKIAYSAAACFKEPS